MWHPIHLRAIKFQSAAAMPASCEMLLYRNVVAMWRHALHPRLFVLLRLHWVNECVLIGPHTFWTKAGSHSPRQKNLPTFVHVDKPLKSLLAPLSTDIIALMCWSYCPQGWLLHWRATIYHQHVVPSWPKMPPWETNQFGAWSFNFGPD